VKPVPFTYHAPTSIDSVVELLADARADEQITVLAGGQSLVPAMADRRIRPRAIVDINLLSAELGSIDRHGPALRIGALVRQRQAERSSVVVRDCPLLAKAIPHIAHACIRNRGTVVGSVAFANPAAEIPVVLLALDGRIHARGQDRARVIDAHDFFRGPHQTALAPHELITYVDFPALPATSGTSFREVARRFGDPAIVGVAAAVMLQDGHIAEARVALTGVGAVPVRAGAAEDMLRGAEATPGVVADVAGVVADALDPAADLLASANYRRHLARRLVAEALGAAIRDAGESAP
jgi:aerobic carbon-monoxide dehydrogenase medium subunit